MAPGAVGLLGLLVSGVVQGLWGCRSFGAVGLAGLLVFGAVGLLSCWSVGAVGLYLGVPLVFFWSLLGSLWGPFSVSRVGKSLNPGLDSETRRVWISRPAGFGFRDPPGLDFETRRVWILKPAGCGNANPRV